MNIPFNVAGITFAIKRDPTISQFRPEGTVEIVYETDQVVLDIDPMALKVVVNGREVGYVPSIKSKYPGIQPLLHDLLRGDEEYSVSVGGYSYFDGDMGWNNDHIGSLQSITLVISTDKKLHETPQKSSQGGDPHILCHPNIPSPLHGIAPRVVMGTKWWNVNRKEAYENAGFKCEACGVKKEDALYHQWLEAHEFYVVDFERKRMVFDHLVALCHACHNFIHSNRLSCIVAEGKATPAFQADIMDRGFEILNRAGLREEWEHRNDGVESVPDSEWADWRMVFDGMEYGPSSQSKEEWAQGVWKEWRP